MPESTELRCKRCNAVIDREKVYLLACTACLAELERRIPLVRILEGYDDSEALAAFWNGK